MEDSIAGTTDEYGVLSRIFSSRAVAQILDFFLDHKEFDYSANEIAKVNMYKLNLDLEAVSFLEKFSLEMSQIAPRETTSPVTSPLTESEGRLVEEMDGQLS